MATSIMSISGLKLLWTNPSPSLSFSAQQIAVPTGPFDAFVIEFRNSKTSTGYTTFVIVKANIETCYGLNIPNGATSSVTFRQLQANNDAITVQDCQYKAFDSTARTTDNDYMIPNRVFGVPK